MEQTTQQTSYTIGEVARLAGITVRTLHHYDHVGHFERQERLLRDRIDRLEQLLAAVQAAKEAQQMGIDLTPEERFDLFGDFDPAEHAEEAERRWGGSEAFRESRRRTASARAPEARRPG